MKPRFDLRHVACFIAVAEERSFRAAARRLNIAQPSISRTIRNLEETVGTLLFERDRRTVTLTDAGRVMLEGGRGLMTSSHELAEAVARVRDGIAGHIRIAYTDLAIGGGLPRLVHGFRTSRPNVTVSFEPMVTGEQIDALRAGLIDVGVGTGPVALDDIDVVPVETQPFFVVAAPGHWTERHEVVEVGALAEEPFILGQVQRWAHFNAHVNRICLNAGFVPRLAHEAVDNHALLGLVASGMGVTISVESLVRDAEFVIYRPIATASPPIPTVAMSRRDDPTLVVKGFLSFIRQTGDR